MYANKRVSFKSTGNRWWGVYQSDAEGNEHRVDVANSFKRANAIAEMMRANDDFSYSVMEE